jgi:Fe-S oxidoreductase
LRTDSRGLHVVVAKDDHLLAMVDTEVDEVLAHDVHHQSLDLSEVLYRGELQKLGDAKPTRV